MLSPNSKYPGPFKPAEPLPARTPYIPPTPPASAAVRIAPMTQRAKLSPWMHPAPVSMPPVAAPSTDPVFNKYPGPMKPPDVPLPDRQKPDNTAYETAPISSLLNWQKPDEVSSGILSPGAGFGQNDVLDAIFQRLGY